MPFGFLEGMRSAAIGVEQVMRRCSHPMAACRRQVDHRYAKNVRSVQETAEMQCRYYRQNALTGSDTSLPCTKLLHAILRCSAIPPHQLLQSPTFASPTLSSPAADFSLSSPSCYQTWRSHRRLQYGLDSIYMNLASCHGLGVSAVCVRGKMCITADFFAVAEFL